ncbi:hypothetical protein ECOLI_350370 [Escherichia coli]|nr:hypothetical protein ECOLI_350370 [Escherichia coli]
MALRLPFFYAPEQDYDSVALIDDHIIVHSDFAQLL